MVAPPLPLAALRGKNKKNDWRILKALANPNAPTELRYEDQPRLS